MHRIYIASSWRNGLQPVLVKELRKRGHKVYDFRHPQGRNDRSVWDTVIKGKLRAAYQADMLKPGEFAALLDDQRAVERFREHLTAMEDADTCILLLPSNRSAHLEAGWMARAGKRVLVMDGGTFAKPELMYLLLDGYFHDVAQLCEEVDKSVPGVCRVCGCTASNACWHPSYGSCCWVEPDLCSHCATVEQGGYGIGDDPDTCHCCADTGSAFK